MSEPIERIREIALTTTAAARQRLEAWQSTGHKSLDAWKERGERALHGVEERARQHAGRVAEDAQRVVSGVQGQLTLGRERIDGLLHQVTPREIVDRLRVDALLAAGATVRDDLLDRAGLVRAEDLHAALTRIDALEAEVASLRKAAAKKPARAAAQKTPQA